MRNYIKRMDFEEQELTRKLDKLTGYLQDVRHKNNVTEEQWLLLDEQRGYMTHYQRVLRERIALEQA